jgi:hypothetical protein
MWSKGDEDRLKKEANPEEVETIAERRDVLNEKATVERSGG